MTHTDLKGQTGQMLFKTHRQRICMNILCIRTFLVKLLTSITLHGFLLNHLSKRSLLLNDVHDQIYTESLKSIKKCFLEPTCANLQPFSGFTY